MANHSNKQAVEALKEKMVKIRNSGLLPKGYAKTIAQKLEIKEDIVYNVAAGRSGNMDVAAEIIEMASQNKLQKLLKLADKVLAD